MDISDTTANAEDVGGNKVFYNAAGVRTVGTGSGYVLKSGDTMTGNLTTKYSTYDVTVNPSADKSVDMYYVTDNNDKTIIFHRLHHRATGDIGYEFGIRRQGSATTADTLWNTIGLFVSNSGDRAVNVSNPSSWRTALGLGTMATEASTSYIKTSGTTTISGNVILSGGYLSLVSNGYNINTAGNTALTFLSISNTSNSKSRWNVGIDANNQITFGAFTANSSAIAEYYRLPKPDATSETIYEILTGKGGSLVAGKHIDVNASGSWWQGRDKAPVRNWGNTSSNYRPIISGKTDTGSWEIGPYNENLNFAYITDTVYNSGTNTGYKAWSINTDGTFSGSVAKFNSVSASGWYTPDDYGSIRHKSSDTSNYLAIQNESGAAKIKLYYETGKIETFGTNISAGTTPSSAQYDYLISGYDKDNVGRGMIRLFGYTDGKQGVALLNYRKVNNTDHYNELRLGVGSDGSYYVFVSANAQAAWRTALGLGTMATANTSSYVPTSGSSTINGTLTANYYFTTGYFRVKTDDNTDPISIVNTSGIKRASIGINSAKRLYFSEYQTAGTNGETYYLPTPTNTSSTTQTYDILTTKGFSLGAASSGATTNFTLSKSGTWMIITGHNSTAAINTVWIARTGGNSVFRVAAGATSGNPTMTLSGTTLSVTMPSGVSSNVYGIYLG